MHPLTEVKEKLKKMTKELRALKQARKPTNENHKPGYGWQIYTKKREYRIEHIAYCLVRGRTYEQIEQPREENKIRGYEWVRINNSRIALEYKVDEANKEWCRLHPEKEISNG